MGSFWQLINEWEIQFLVLLSFTLQVFLFFTGSLRRSTTNTLLRVSIWAAYLGADMVAIYALGYLSRHEDATMGGTLKRTHMLTSFWAPFLLIHLGGQDTITAFAIEDNNLWLRHLLNMIVQVALALYVFWKSASWQNTYLLVAAILLFAAGMIKYGERTVALYLGNLNSIKESTSDMDSNILLPYLSKDDNYGLVCTALVMRPSILELFSRRSLYNDDNDLIGLSSATLSNKKLVIKLVDVELGIIMYNDLYTKAALLRTRSGIVLRCISQLCTIVSLVVFVVGAKKADYGRADVVITYILFAGGFALEVCAVLTMFMASPWTWAWLKARQCGSRLAGMSWSLLSSGLIGWLGTRPLWSNTMGQYSLLRCLGYDKPVNFSQWVMSLIRRMAMAIGIGDVGMKLLWMSKLLDTSYETVDDMITEYFVEEIRRLRRDEQLQWPHMGLLLKTVETGDLVSLVFDLHLFTEVYLSEAFRTSRVTDRDLAALAGACRKLSNYMFYLLVAHPASASMLQLATTDPEAMFQTFRRSYELPMPGSMPETILRPLARQFKREMKIMSSSTEQRNEVLEEMKRMWVRILIYAAGKSRPEVHAAQLAKGGELLTFIWLLMAHHGIGDGMDTRVELISVYQSGGVRVRYAFKNLPERPHWSPIGPRDDTPDQDGGVKSSTRGLQQWRPMHPVSSSGTQPFSKTRTSCWLQPSAESSCMQATSSGHQEFRAQL